MANPTLDRLEAVTAQLEKLAAQLSKAGGRGGGDDSKIAPSAEAWNDYFTDYVQPFINACKKLNLADTQRLAETGWKNVGDLMQVAPNAKKPSQGDLSKFVKPAADAIGEAGGLKDKRRKETINQDSAFAELIMALGWVMQPKPMPFIQGQLEAADFYLTKVLTTNKDAPNKEDHRAWVKTAKEMLSEMKNFVKEFHRTGVEYKGQGSIFDAAGAKPAAGGAPAPPPGGVPPPVPPPAAGGAAPAASSSGGSSGGFGAVLASINKGSAITSGLKKVTADMKTKNRKERPGLVKAAPKKSAPSKWSAKKEVDKPSSIRKERGTHVVEYFKSGQASVPETAEMKEGVFIYKCGEAFVTVPKKVKNITIDSCKKTRIVIEKSVVSTVEVVNSQSVTVIVVEPVNSIAVDKTSGCQIWCQQHCELELISSMISEVNIQMPPPESSSEDADPVENAVAEQFKTVVTYPTKNDEDGRKVPDFSKPFELVTESVKHG